MAHESWNPPDSPDPHAILNEAVADTRAGRYSVALEKHVWFHANALKYEQGLAGVRLSFALSYWHDLALRFPPAMESLSAARDESESKFLANGFQFNQFHDLAALNRTLNVQHKTVDAFRNAHDSNPTAAKAVYHVAEPALIAAAEYELCGAYLEPEAQFKMAVRCFQLTQQHEESRPSTVPAPPRTSKPRFIHTVATLISLLVINNRKPEAERVASLAREELDDNDLVQEIQNALDGTVPSPYP